MNAAQGEVEKGWDKDDGAPLVGGYIKPGGEKQGEGGDKGEKEDGRIGRMKPLSL
jgi:hypothetical protein